MTVHRVLSARNIPRWLEVAGQLVAVTAVLLPVLGSVVRLVSFAVTPGVSTALELAPATSLPDLVGAAMTGLAPSFAATLWYLVIYGAALALWREARRAWGTPVALHGAAVSSNHRLGLVASRPLVAGHDRAIV